MRKYQSSHRRDRNGLVIPILLIAVLGAAGLFALQRADRAEIVYDEAALAREAEVLSDVVDVGGIACTPKKNIRSYLIMGIDDTAAQGEDYVMGGQCDVLNLLVVDHTNMTYQYLPINRNTICDVRWYDVDGNDMGTSEIQIAYAHAVGDGGAFSCENVVEAVSNYLGGVDIQSYIAMNIDSIGKINQLVGGVTVTIEDDFSAIDPSLVKGETITLTDEQAETFVRARMNMKDDSTNEARMRRQQVFLDALREQMLEKAKADAGYALGVYESLESEMVTNMNGKAFSRLVNGLTECENLGPIEITGSIGEDDLGYATFVADRDSVRDAEIALFYKPADGSPAPLTPGASTSSTEE